MMRYHFNTQDGVTVPDADGVELATSEQAEMQAVMLAGEMLQEQAKEFWRTGSFTVTVTDDTGLALFTIITEAIRSPAYGRRP